jgi:hypothetical protein
MALQVTSTALGDITSGVGLDLKISNQAARQTATLDFEYRHATNALLPEDEIQVYDGATRVFRGRIRNRKRQDTGPGPQRRRVYSITCQDTTTYLADDVIDTTLVLAAGTSDQAMLQAVIAYSRSVTAAAPYNQVVVASMPADIDVSGMTVYDAVVAITAVTGAQFYVDDSLRLHNYTTESNSAPFALVDNAANGSTRIGIRDLSLPDETFELVNAVWCIGGLGTTPEWRPAPASWPTASHTAYGRRERTLRVPDCTSQAELQRLGDALLAAQDTPRTPITCTLFAPGLKAGMTANLESSLWSVNTTLPIVQVDTTIVPGTKGTLQYEVTLGDLADDLGNMMQSISTRLDQTVALVEDVAGADTTLPAQVQSLTLTAGNTIQADGVAYPSLAAAWANTGMPSDWEAYEVELAAAIQGQPQAVVSVSGTGGTLGAGVYTVVVTGLGTVAGETTGVTQQVTLATGQRLYVNITALAGMGSYRVYAKRATSSPNLALTTSTTGSNVEVTTEGTTGATPPSESTAVDFGLPFTARTTALSALFAPVAGGVWHQARVRAVDRTGNRSASWSALASAKSSADSTAPAVPQGLTAVPGYRLVGLRWSRNAEADLARYQVRYYQGASDPSDPTDWVVADTSSPLVVIQGLNADAGASIVYRFQVQAIDRSGNASGWTSPSVTANPTLVGAADMAVNSVVANLLSAGTISADYISGGTLKVGGLASLTTQVTVLDSQGRTAGLWSDTQGLVVYDVTNDARRIRMNAGALQFSKDGGATWTTGMDADGITASAILLGSLAGGPNAVPNAGFEMAAFQTVYSTTWTATGDWSADIPTAGTYRVNVDRSTGALKMTTYT